MTAVVAAPLRAVDTLQTRTLADAVELVVRLGVRGTDPALRGHFPGLVVFPGVYTIESLCQAMAELGAVLRVLRSARFTAPLLDGDELTLRITATRRGASAWDVRATGTRRDGVIACRLHAEFEAAEVEAAGLEIAGSEAADG